MGNVHVGTYVNGLSNHTWDKDTISLLKFLRYLVCEYCLLYSLYIFGLFLIDVRLTHTWIFPTMIEYD